MNIYVGNLPYRLTEENLRRQFESYGEVSSATIIKDKMTNRSKGYGFVEMPNSDEAQNAIQNLNEFEMEGRNIKVNEAREREERPRGDFNRGGDRRDRY